MFFKNLKNKLLLLLLTLIIIPTNIYAYSEYIIASGENVGIELKASYVMIVGTYQIGDINPAKDAGLKSGDQIVKINNKEITSINNMLESINESNSSIKVEYQRLNKKYNTTLKLIKDNDNIIKTGLYVKDSISGVGTLTFIDPKTKLFGALGHEILEKNTGKKIEIKDGKIYNSNVTSITKSSNGVPGEKNARYNTDDIYGKISENTNSGIFGNYIKEVPTEKLYKVAKSENIKLGKAKILTVLKDENVEQYDIKILKINESDSNKNILFEIIDPNLLKITGGIVQGMSGSPIIQDDYIVGAVTHVVIDNPIQGYGIFIVNMLEEAEN